MPNNAILIEAFALGGSGYRVAVKDSIDIASHVTRGASEALAGAPPAGRNAEVVEALLNADCLIIGKANMHELAYGVTGINHWAGTPANPLYPGYIPGGSSSGSAAAVAAGLCDFAIGTDTGGSIRMPAACCGVFGLKPSYGRVSRQGAHPANSSLDCVGPMAGSVTLIEAAMEIIDPSFKAIAAPEALRLGRIDCQVSSEVEEAFESSLRESGAASIAVALDLMDDAFAQNMVIIGAETWAAFGHLTASHKLGEDVRARLLKASEITAQQLAHAESVRMAFRQQVDAALEQVDALILPTLPAFPPTLGEAADAVAALALTGLVRQFNLSGHPALTIPVGTPQGLPVGIQLVGRIGGDEALCAAARRFAQAIETVRPLSEKEQSQ